MKKSSLVIATRKSALALWQAENVKSELLKYNPRLNVELLPMSTRGDKILDTPLAKIGGKGLFLKELEQAMLDGRADIAVHSMKDVPVELPGGLSLTHICQRQDPHDAFVSNKHNSLDELPKGAVIGTSSLRRQAQLKYFRPDLVIKSCRGNVNTRLKKLDDDEYDAIILASAGLLRLKFADRIKQSLSMEISLPAVGQGAVGIECRSDDSTTHLLLEPLHHNETAVCLSAERALNKTLQGGCQVPVAAHASINKDKLTLIARVVSIDGKRLLKAEFTDSIHQAENTGALVAQELLANGADEILEEVHRQARQSES